MAVRFWQCGDRRFDLSAPVVMGILNVTPDSFSDGGEFADPGRALEHGLRMAADGAHIIDVGGESTRPGAEEVSEEEELRRVVPVVGALASRGLAVSVDTSRASVMEAALAAGACILNDVRAFSMPGALKAAARSGAGVVIMHGWQAAREDASCGEGVIARVTRYLKMRQDTLERAGVSRERICWDPGFGFGKNTDENFALLAGTPELAASGQPLLMALSRKRSLGEVSGIREAARRVSASVAGALLALERGAQVVRVHDVRETVEAISVLRAVRKAQQNQGEY